MAVADHVAEPVCYRFRVELFQQRRALVLELSEKANAESREPGVGGVRLLVGAARPRPSSTPIFRSRGRALTFFPSLIVVPVPA